MIVATYFGLFMPALRPVKTLGDDPRELQVRSRRAVDLERLRDLYLPELGEVIQLKGTDYQYRAYCTREEWGRALARIAGDIDYEKFKDTPKLKLKDGALSDAYLRLWNATLNAFPTGSSYDWKTNKTSKSAFAALPTTEHVHKRLSDLTQSQRDRLWDEREPDIWELARIESESEYPSILWDMSETQRRSMQFAVDDHIICDHADTKSARRRCRRRQKGK